jgi:hypothetical protein
MNASVETVTATASWADRFSQHCRARWPQIRRSLPRDLAVLAAVFVVSRFVGLAWVQTDSVHTRVALLLKGVAVRPGDLAVFAYDGDALPRYYADSALRGLMLKRALVSSTAGPARGTGFVKVLFGVDGDRIEVRGRDVILHTRRGSFAMGRCKERSRNGDPLEPIAEQVIPPGQVYMWAPHVNALDSRYAVMGLVRADRLAGRAIALW